MTEIKDQKAREAEFYRRLEEQGLWLRRPKTTPVPTSFQPIPIQGKPLSEMMVEDRR